jgi:hypothetical protein
MAEEKKPENASMPVQAAGGPTVAPAAAVQATAPASQVAVATAPEAKPVAEKVTAAEPTDKK